MNVTHNLSDLSPADQRTFLSLWKSASDLSIKIAELTATKEEITRAAAELAASLGIKKLVTTSWQLSETQGRETLDVNLLQLNGVDIDTINKSKKRGKPFYSFRKLGDKQE